MRIYLAGPMRGFPQFNYLEFRKASLSLRAQGHEVFDPTDTIAAVVGLSIEGEVEEALTSQFRRMAMANNTQWICRNADAIALMSGWAYSSGARAEKALAEALGLEVIFLPAKTVAAA